MAQRLSCSERRSYKVTELGFRLRPAPPQSPESSPQPALPPSLQPGPQVRRKPQVQGCYRGLLGARGGGGAVCCPIPCFAAWGIPGVPSGKWRQCWWGRVPFPNPCQQHTKDANQVSPFSAFPLWSPTQPQPSSQCKRGPSRFKWTGPPILCMMWEQARQVLSS